MQTKYITSGGLAFSEKRDMEKLRRYSLKGWHVRSFTLMGYILEKGDKTDYIYSIDYQALHDNEKEEYIDFFSSAGWSHVTSEGNIQLFKARPGTPPIYTDGDTMATKYKTSSDSMQKWAVPLFALTLLMWISVGLTAGTFNVILSGVALILTVLSIPTLMTVFATWYNKWKVEDKRKLVFGMRSLPFVALLLALATLLFYQDKGLIVSSLTSGTIGAIAFPVAIWFIMSLYHKIRQN